MYEKVHLTLHHHQLRKLLKGEQVQLKHEQLHGSNHHLMLHPETAKKVHRAKRLRKGVRVRMSHHELEASGEGIKDLLSKLKKGYDFVKHNVIDTPLYQQNVKPIVRGLVNAGESALLASTGNNPLAQLGVKGINLVGEKSGAYGVRGRKKKFHHEDSVGLHPKKEPQMYLSPLLSTSHPANNPTYPVIPHIGGSLHKRGRKKKGGSFLAA